MPAKDSKPVARESPALNKAIHHHTGPHRTKSSATSTTTQKKHTENNLNTHKQTHWDEMKTKRTLEQIIMADTFTW